jgi:hypothetical protein
MHALHVLEEDGEFASYLALRAAPTKCLGYKNANRLVADNPDREERRAVLKDNKERLEQAGDRLRDLNRTFYAQNAGLVG